VTVVDAHVHVGLTQYVVVDVLVSQMEAAGIDKALLVQYGGCFNNAYLRQCRERFPGRFAALGMVDYDAPDAAEQIRREVEENDLAGLRIPASTTNEAVWATVGELGIMASLSGRVDGDGVENCIRRFPQVRFRLEHMGFPDLSQSPDAPDYQRLMGYAAYPNVYLMISGLYAFGAKHPYPEVTPFVKRAVECFGPEHLMWGSDFPRVCDWETCEMTLALPHTWDFVSEADLEWILGKTALSILEFD
jgi:L-fuconolactonase